MIYYFARTSIRIVIPHDDSSNKQEDSQSVRRVQEPEEIRELRKQHRDIFTEVLLKFYLAYLTHDPIIITRLYPERRKP